ncbi:serine/threonine protein kinase, partial [Streptococcus pyogenes]
MSMMDKTVLYFGLVEISFDVPDFIFQKIKEQNNKIRYYSKSINILGSVCLLYTS